MRDATPDPRGSVYVNAMATRKGQRGALTGVAPRAKARRPLHAMEATHD
ncbi:MAG: hypothetical protein ABI629_02820 [bacterium]